MSNDSEPHVERDIALRERDKMAAELRIAREALVRAHAAHAEQINELRTYYLRAARNAIGDVVVAAYRTLRVGDHGAVSWMHKRLLEAIDTRDTNDNNRINDIEQARAEERERCARECERLRDTGDFKTPFAIAAHAIRALGPAPTLDVMAETLRVSSVVSRAKSEDEQTRLLAGELTRIIGAARALGPVPTLDVREVALRVAREVRLAAGEAVLKIVPTLPEALLSKSVEAIVDRVLEELNHV